MANKKRFPATADMNGFLQSPASSYDRRHEMREETAMLINNNTEEPETKQRKNATVRTSRPCRVCTYVSTEMKQQIDLIKARTGIGIQDIAYAVLKHFLDENFNDAEGLTEKGKDFVIKYL